jgi:uncharacterized membrane protein SpoIIM required for sporulation
VTTESGLAHWLKQRAGTWQALTQTAQRLGSGRAHRAEDALAAVEGYRSLGRDLSIARRVLPGSRVTQGLEALYARLHASIYRAPHNWSANIRALFRDEIPQVARDLRRYIVWVTMLFIVASIAGWWLIQTYPELIGLVASEDMIATVEEGRLWTHGILNVTPSSVLSVQILTNNIAVSLTALCVGIFFGLGTFYIISLNGFMLGSVFAFTHQHGLSGELLKFVVAHGFVELSVIFVAGAAGMSLGASLAIPTHATRRESFQHATAQAGKLILLCAVLLVGCGFIEGYVSPDPDFSMTTRVVIGVGYWIIMITALTGHLFKRLKA